MLAVPGRAGTLLVGLRWLTGPVPAIMLVVEPVMGSAVGWWTPEREVINSAAAASVTAAAAPARAQMACLRVGR